MEEEARQRLLRVALKLFVERGYAATTVREIVAGAGVTKPALYYHFKNKEGLYLEIMNGITTAFEQQVAELGNSQGTIRERLIHFLGGLLDGAREQIDAVRLAYSIFFGPPQGAPFVDFERIFDRILEIVEALLKEGMACGQLPACDSWLKAWVIVGTYNTIMEEQLCRKTPRIGKEALIEIIILQLETPGSTERKA